jgi:hypothetical protein
MLLAILAACTVDENVERGTVDICLADPKGEVIDQELFLRGIVGPPDPTSECQGAQSFSIVDDFKGVYTWGFSVRDEDGSDITPALDVGEGDEVHLFFRDRLVWGDVAGFVLGDFEEAMIAAADEGTWGGALDPGEVNGLTVERGHDVIAREPMDCQPIEGYEIEFSAEDDAVLTPVDSEEISIRGRSFTATAVAAWDYGEDDNCQITDATGATSWVVYH